MESLTNRKVVVSDKPMTFMEKLYIPGIIKGMLVTLRHMLMRRKTVKYPEEVREFALEQEFKVRGNYPGMRTEPFANEDIKETIESIIAPFAGKITRWHTEYTGCFQYTTAYDRSWIHADSWNDWAGVLYLTPNSKIESGTSFYSKNNNYNEEKLSQKKIDFFLNKTDEEEYFKTLKEHNNNFTKNLTIGNIFNRLIVYDPTMYHAHDNLLNTEERLIQVFHVSKFNAKMSPLERMRRYD